MLMSMEHFRDYIKPYKKEIVEYAHAKGLKCMKHSDGNMWALVDELIDIGFDGFHPVQPQCMNLAEVKAWFDGRVCMFGNVDCLDLLVFGTPDMVDEAVKQCIAEGSHGGGHILCSSNSLHPGVLPENALAMFRAAKTYGLNGQMPAQIKVRKSDLNISTLAKEPTRRRERRSARRAVA
jgi:uroporphyrinogen decarboxylase